MISFFVYTSHQNHPELDKPILDLIKKLEKLAKLMTSQPESVLMAIRFNGENLVQSANQELKRLVLPEPFMDDFSTSISTSEHPSVRFGGI